MESKKVALAAAIVEFDRKVAELEKKTEVAAEAIPEIIKLNVGGIVFDTTKATLRKHKDSFFDALFRSSLFTIRNGTGEIFIDRDPTHFERILKFVSSETLSNFFQLSSGFII